MKLGIIIQARMGSSRFPGKVLQLLHEAPVLEHVVTRCSQSVVRPIVVATTTNKEDQEIVNWCLNHACEWWRGTANDVLLRMIDAATWKGLTHVIRVNADCPFIEPDKINALAIYEQYDYVGYLVEGQPAIRSHVGLPELVSVEWLKKCKALVENMTEHVTWLAHGVLWPQVEAKTKWITCVDHTLGEHNTVDIQADLDRLQRRCKSPLTANK